jgi:hypothetical protein
MVRSTAAVEVIREDALNRDVRCSCDPTDGVSACDWGSGRVFGHINFKAALEDWHASFCRYEEACITTTDPSSTSLVSLGLVYQGSEAALFVQ